MQGLSRAKDILEIEGMVRSKLREVSNEMHYLTSTPPSQTKQYQFLSAQRTALLDILERLKPYVSKANYDEGVDDE